MVAIHRRDLALSTPSLAILAAGGASLLIATCLSVLVYVHYRNLRRLRMKMVAEAKRAAIGAPVLQRAPEHLIDTSIDMGKMSHEMREQFAQDYRRTQASRSVLYQQHRSDQAALSSSQSGGSSSSSSSGPIPTSSSDRSLHYQSKLGNKASMPTQQMMRVPVPQVPRRPSVAVAEVRPTFAREQPVSRVTVPSALLRGLGDLPQMPEPGMGRRSSSPELKLADMDCLTPEIGHPSSSGMSTGLSSSSLPYANSPGKTSSYTSSTVVCHKKRTTGGPAPVTVDYFSQIGRRALAPPQSEPAKQQMPLKSCLASAHSRSSSGAQSNKSPHKRPSFVLPPLPTHSTNGGQAERKLPVTKPAVSDFRPLSLGLVSSSKSGSLGAADLFSDMSHLLLFDASPDADKSRATNDSKRESDVFGLHATSIESMMRAFSPNSLRRESGSSEASTVVDEMSLDAFDDANEYAADGGAGLVHKAEVRQSAINDARAIPTIVLPEETSSQLPFQTPHHHTLIPDPIVLDDQRSSRALSPDLSQIHDAPLPPQGLPVQASVGSPAKPSFTSSLKAKLSLGRVRSATLQQQQQTLQQQQRSAASSSSGSQRRSAASSSVKSSEAGRESYGPAVETWNVSTKDASTPVFRIVPGPKAMAAQPLGLGLSDENGRNMDHEMANSPLFQANDNISPIISDKPWAERRHQAAAQQAGIAHTANEDKVEMLSRRSYDHQQQHEEALGTPPMRQMAAPQFAIMSHAPNKLGQTPTVIGSDWALNSHNEADRSIHRQSVASSVCDTISSCMTGPSERMSMYDGRRAQDQRTRLLEMIQQNKVGQKNRESQQSSSMGTNTAGFVSHTATSPPSYGQSSSGVMSTNMHKGGGEQRVSSTSSRKPVHLSIHPAKNAGDGSIAPHSAPLTPPHTPGDETPTLRSTRKVLAPAAPVAEKTPTMDDPQFARHPKLRPLSLAIQQQQQQQQQQASSYHQQYQHQQHHQQAGTHAAINRFMASSGSASLHRSQYSSHSSSSRTSGSMTPIPSASSSHTSISQHYSQNHHHHNSQSPSRKRISLLLASTNSPARSSFSTTTKMTLSRSGAVPIGVLPTLAADSSPSFITSIHSSSIASRGGGGVGGGNNTGISTTPYHTPSVVRVG